MLRLAQLLLLLAIVVGVFAFDLLGDHGLDAIRPLVPASLVLATGLVLADAFLAPHRAVGAY